MWWNLPGFHEVICSCEAIEYIVQRRSSWKGTCVGDCPRKLIGETPIPRSGVNPYFGRCHRWESEDTSGRDTFLSKIKRFNGPFTIRVLAGRSDFASHQFGWCLHGRWNVTYEKVALLESCVGSVDGMDCRLDSSTVWSVGAKCPMRSLIG